MAVYGSEWVILSALMGRVVGVLKGIGAVLGDDGANSTGLEGGVQALETVFGQLSERVKEAGWV